MTNSPGLQQAAAAELLARRKARRGLLDFTLYTKPDYQVNWHHRVLCEYLDRFVDGSIRRLMVLMPPRHGKSELVSRRLPAYIFGRNPNARVIAASYGADLASRMNRDVQRIIDSAEYARLFPDTALWGANVRTVAQGTYLRNSDLFEIVGHSGSYRSAGVGGGITGMGFDYGIIDDPLKDFQQANSPTVRETVWDWYTSTFYTRQEKAARILITVTRWHMDDLVGRLLTAEGGEYADQWTILSFPAIAEHEQAEGDPRVPGEALWPGKYDLDTLRGMEAALGPYSFAALYQQRPTPAEGGLFKLSYFEPARLDAPPLQQVVRYWDLAMSEKTSADYTVGLKLGLDQDAHRFVLDVARKQIDWGDLTEYMAQVMIADGPSVAQGIEAKGYQSRAIQMLNADPRLHGYSIFGYEADKDKFTRALPAAAKAAAGCMHVLDRHWTPAFLDEVCAFPNAAHDDQVDALSGAENMLGDTGVLFAGSLAYGDSGQSASHY